jgi:hypothetical protein
MSLSGRPLMPMSGRGWLRYVLNPERAFCGVL